jgi:hypothetical protein
MRRIGLWVLMLSLLFSLQGCLVPEFSSEWLGERLIRIDGSPLDWQGVSGIDMDGILVRVLNDDANLYLCIVAESNAAKVRLFTERHRAFTIWLDPKGGHAYAQGLRVSVSLDSMNIRWDDLQNSVVRLYAVDLKAKEKLRYIVSGKQDDLDMKVSFGARWVLEIKVPLVCDGLERFALPNAPGSLLGVYFETLYEADPAQELNQNWVAGGAYAAEAPRQERFVLNHAFRLRMAQPQSERK